MVTLEPVPDDLLETAFDYFNALRGDWSDVVHPEFDWSAEGFIDAFSDHGVLWLVAVDNSIVGWVTEMHREDHCEVGYWVDGSLHPWAIHKAGKAYIENALRRHEAIRVVFIGKEIKRRCKSLNPTTLTDRGASWAAVDQLQNLRNRHQSRVQS